MMKDIKLGTAVFGVTMECMTEASSDNVTAASASKTTSSTLAYSSENFRPYTYFAIVVSFIGIVANGLLSVLMIKLYRSSASTTNVLIASQCLIDMFYSLGSFLSYCFGPKHYSQPPTTLDTIICVLIDSGTCSALFQNSSTAGLIAITLERYWKVVHPIGHRKYYRHWMTRVAICATWMSGFVTFLLPSVFTTRILYGQCYLTAVWPSLAASEVR